MPKLTYKYRQILLFLGLRIIFAIMFSFIIECIIAFLFGVDVFENAYIGLSLPIYAGFFFGFLDGILYLMKYTNL